MKCSYCDQVIGDIRGSRGECPFCGAGIVRRKEDNSNTCPYTAPLPLFAPHTHIQNRTFIIPAKGYIYHEIPPACILRNIRVEFPKIEDCDEDIQFKLMVDGNRIVADLHGNTDGGIIDLPLDLDIREFCHAEMQLFNDNDHDQSLDIIWCIE